jgi:hypothetical protein
MTVKEAIEKIKVFLASQQSEETPETPVETPVEETPAEEVPAEPVQLAEETPEETPVEQPDFASQIAALKDENAQLRNEISAIKEANAQFAAQAQETETKYSTAFAQMIEVVEKLATEPSAEPVQAPKNAFAFKSQEDRGAKVLSVINQFKKS